MDRAVKIGCCFCLILFSISNGFYLSASNVSPPRTVVMRFKPLEKNEKLVYKIAKDGRIGFFQLFAQIIDKTNRRQIGEWENINYWAGPLGGVNGLEFSLDRKYCYFSQNEPSDGAETRSVFFVNGPAGKVECILKHLKSSFRSSDDGKYIIYGDTEFNSESKELKRFKVYNSISGKIEAEPSWEINDEDGVDVFYFRRNKEDNKIKVLLVADDFSIVAIGIIDLGNFSLIGDWTQKGKNGHYPNLKDKEWRDDIINQDDDKTLRIIE
jgi:hypothetical protein